MLILILFVDNHDYSIFNMNISTINVIVLGYLKSICIYDPFYQKKGGNIANYTIAMTLSEFGVWDE